MQKYNVELAFEILREKLEEYGNYIASSTRHKCKRNVSEFSSMNEENGAIFNCGCNTPRKLLGEIPASPVKNQAQRNRSLCGPEEFRVRQGMPEFRPVEEGVQGNSSNRKGALALSPPVKQELCTGSNPDGWNYVYKSQYQILIKVSVVREEDFAQNKIQMKVPNPGFVENFKEYLNHATKYCMKYFEEVVPHD